MVGTDHPMLVRIQPSPLKAIFEHGFCPVNGLQVRSLLSPLKIIEYEILFGYGVYRACRGNRPGEYRDCVPGRAAILC